MVTQLIHIATSRRLRYIWIFLFILSSLTLLPHRIKADGGLEPSITAISRNPDQLDVFTIMPDAAVYTTSWNPQSGWAGINGWQRISPTGFVQMGQCCEITAVSRNPNQIDLFIVGMDDAIYTTWWNPHDGWVGINGWQRISPFGFARHFSAGASVVSRNPNQLDIFVTGVDGAVYTTWWNSTTGWRSSDFSGGIDIWKRLSPIGAFSEYSNVTAVSRNPNQIDLFTSGKDAIYTTWWNPHDGWVGINGWQRISPLFSTLFNPPYQYGFAPYKVYAISRNPEQLDLFAIDGVTYDVYTTWWNAQSGWAGLNGWQKISSGNVIQNWGEDMGVVSPNPNQLDIIARGRNASVVSTRWTAASGWDGINGWHNVSPAGTLGWNGGVSAVVRKPNQIDVFKLAETDSKGGKAVFTTWWNPQDGWAGINGWLQISPKMSATQVIPTPIPPVQTPPHRAQLTLSVNPTELIPNTLRITGVTWIVTPEWNPSHALPGYQPGEWAL